MFIPEVHLFAVKYIRQGTLLQQLLNKAEYDMKNYADRGRG